ncbi:MULTISPECIES: hypothetical protein [unclassified Lysobacter]|uniref:hypothetical protein n=1 Tax=unclassified Lysobacter TaxID=2635362 RepID=UPI0006FED575|nr:MULTISPECIES: hypothetical protein [unclassified Lysobacter]KRA21020.1 hypothetical protein ASD69_06945 [Lysobacter sp. Root604]KRD40025.1 hypothetical protein ASE35_06885 [Lysobacter sp. Root916]
MIVLSGFFYALAHHPFWSWLALVLLALAASLLMVRWTGKARWMLLLLAAFIGGQLNIFTGHILNAWFLNAYGSRGTAVIVHSELTNSTLNDQYISDYWAVLRTADGRDVKIEFDTMSASIYPIRNEILLPPQGQRFVVKYVPGFERNVAIMSDESDYGRRWVVAQARGPVDRAAAQLAASPDNPEFVEEYRSELRRFLDQHRKDADPALVVRFERELGELEQRR